MTKGSKIVLGWCTPLFLLLVGIAVGLGRFHRSFPYATWTGDWRRIPLKFPYELIDFDSPFGVALSNWQSDRIFATRRVFPLGTSDEEKALSSLDGIFHIGFTDHLLLGERDLRFMRAYLGTRYFVFDLSAGKVCHYKTEEEFLGACREYGITSPELRTFDEWYECHENKVSKVPVWRQVVSGIWGGFEAKGN